MEEFGKVRYSICRETGKRMMPKRDAVATINFTRSNKQRGGKQPTACYRCNHCNHWHLTRDGNGVKSR